MSHNIVYINGDIYTADKKNPYAETIAVSDGKIVYVGSKAGAEKYISSADEIIDLNRSFVMPSFFEAHAHCGFATKKLHSVDLSQANSVEDYIEQLKAYHKNHSKEPFIDGTGWKNTLFPESGPTKEILDEISKDIPIILQSEDIHSLWVNSKALEMAGVTKKTPDPEGTGRIERDEMGNPSGCLRESAKNLVEYIRPDYTVLQYQQGAQVYAGDSFRYGITGSLDAMVFLNSNSIQAMKELDMSNKLPMYSCGALRIEPDKGIGQIADCVEIKKKTSNCSMYYLNTVKIVIDGVVEGGTGYLMEPYCEAAQKGEGYYGLSHWSQNSLNEIIAEADKNGFQVHVHAIGDRATKMTMEAFEYAEAMNGNISRRRHIVTHLQLVREEDICKFKELGVIACINPYWHFKDDYYYNIQVPYLGKERAEHEYPNKSFLDQGVIVVSASDFPVTSPVNPLEGIQIGATRTVPGGGTERMSYGSATDVDKSKYKEPLWIEEAATVQEMIDSFTINAAYSCFLEKETGSLSIGKNADMVILDKNILTVPVHEISKIKVLRTILKGTIVYDCGGL